MAYKVIGITDSEKEGWFKNNPDCPLCCTSRTEIDTPLGKIIADVSGDESYPGIWLSFKPNGETRERTVALLESNTPESVVLRLYLDKNSDEHTETITIEQKEG